MMTSGPDPVWRILGRLEAQQDMMASNVAEDRGRQERLSVQMDEISAELSDHESRLMVLESRPAVRSPSVPVEALVKWLTAIALPLATLWATGSVQEAIAVLEKVRAAP